jgi:beta-1,4-mannosyl-glycoprotein beta-1,4-N-acetylglucosaminyltransferase
MDKPRVFDCFPFFNELDVLEIRLSELDALVDYFVIVEATRTHTGKPKPLYFADNRRRYKCFDHKIIHVVVDDLPLGASDHWGREIFQRQAIVRGLGQARPDDRIISSDCDEIPKADVLRRALALPGLSHRIVAFWCENYFYRLNLRNDAHDHRLGPRLVTMSNLKSPNAVREIPFRFSKRPYLRSFTEPVAALRVAKRLGKVLWPTILWSGAWHFTWMGDLTAVNLKFDSIAPHQDQSPRLSESAYQRDLATFRKCSLDDLPRIVRQERFAHLMA